MIFLVVAAALQIPNPHVIRIDGTRTSYVGSYEIYEQMNGFMGSNLSTYTTDVEYAAIFNNQALAELWATELRYRMKIRRWNASVWVTKNDSWFQYSTGYHSLMRFLGKDEL